MGQDRQRLAARIQVTRRPYNGGRASDSSKGFGCAAYGLTRGSATSGCARRLVTRGTSTRESMRGNVGRHQRNHDGDQERGVVLIDGAVEEPDRQRNNERQHVDNGETHGRGERCEEPLRAEVRDEDMRPPGIERAVGCLGTRPEPRVPKTILKTAATHRKPALLRRMWSPQWDSNPRPFLYEGNALPLSYRGTYATCRVKTGFPRNSAYPAIVPKRQGRGELLSTPAP